ncbi:MAG TPA: amidohydrolase [Chthonomonadaceae bacterium]|nr:amidohydrolase [Chthonomonadaceae bacterium]
MPNTDLIKNVIATLTPQIVETRHYLHQNPELSHQEQNTSAFVAERLRALGLDDVQAGVGGYGVVGTLRGTAAGAETGPTFALRADMDALPIQEESDLPYKSCNPGVMHACGHDGHTATLLGTAAVLAQLRDQIRGTVKFFFQPAEETVGGAARMCAEGVMEGVEAIVALHGWPGVGVGQIGVRSGPMMASADTFDITVKGRGAHAAMPHISVDPIVVGAQIVLALQTIVSREISPVESVVVTVTQFHAGTAYNILPGAAEIKGTVRCLSDAVRASMPERLERIARGICEAARAEYAFRYQEGTPVTVNDEGMTALVAEVGREVLGEGNVVTLEAPSMGAEDFAVYLRHAPGTMFRLGVGEEMPPLHTPRYNFADAALSYGMELFTQIALRYLEASPSENA